MKRHLLVVGASVAGPALAYWLHRFGFEVTVLERAPALRPGGQAIDVRGVAKEVLRRMGLAEQVRAACVDTLGASTVTRHNRRLTTVRADMHGGDGPLAEIEILRGDLAEVFHTATASDTEYLFGDRIEVLTQDQDGSGGVAVRFAGGSERRFDLVVGADGLHSGVRALAFGPESDYLHDLGLYLTFFSVPNYLGLDRWALEYREPGRVAGIRSIRGNTAAMAYFGFLGEPRAGDSLDSRDVEAQRAIVRERISGMAWEAPRLLAEMDRAPDFYFDTCAQIRMDTWSEGRVVLLGDAAYCPSPLSGQGTSLAIVGAFVLAGELAEAYRAGAEHPTAFTRFQQTMRGYVAANQRMGRDNAASALPRRRSSIWRQNLMLRLAPYLPARSSPGPLRDVVNAIDLPDYTHLEQTSPMP